MKKILFTVSIAILITLLPHSIFAQSVPVGTPVLEDYYRVMQLLGKVDSSVSFSLRPTLTPSLLKVSNVFDPDSAVKKNHWVHAGPVVFGNGNGLFQILPINLQQQYNSDHPYGWNDGAMIPAKGYQTMFSAGFFLKYGPLSIQLRPEYVYAANPPFNGFASGHGDQDLMAYYGFHSLIDQPERFGNTSYNKLFWGQSSIRLTFGAASIGLSNENLWWGPGIKNALVLTNNAPGFKHLTLNTVRPVKTYIGSFEGQIIAGRLDGSGYPNLLTTSTSTGINLYAPRVTDWRYFTGININYHPKWVPGLTLGYIRTFDAYKNDVHSVKDYLPYFFSYFKKSTNNVGDPIPRDQLTSLYARYLFTKAQAEVYFEYGVEDNSYNLNDFIGSPDHSRAYILGLRKIISLSGSTNQHLLFSTEITQLSANLDRTIREGGIWYVNSQVTYGHTYKGQVLGAGTGSGGNVQSMNLSWISGLNKLGVGVERYEHDVDFLHGSFPDINGNSRNWVDYAVDLQGTYAYKNLLFNAKLQGIKSLNYEWILKNYNPADTYYIPHNDVFNLHAELGVTFLF